jgi:hypothetical protein
MSAVNTVQAFTQASAKLTRRIFCASNFAGTQFHRTNQILKRRTMSGNAARLLIVATCICLSACTRFVEPLVSAGLGEDEQTKQPEEKETCARLNELKIGMTASQVLSACERKPLRTSDIITRDGKKVIVWTYGGSYLHLAGDKLVQIFDLER